MAADPTPPAPVAAAWTAVGPSVTRNGQAFSRPPVSGRVTGIAVSQFGDVVYVATSNGGVWRSDDSGASWRSLMDDQNVDPAFAGGRADSLACGAVAIHPDFPQRVFVGSGETGAAGHSFLGIGPLVSQDGGNHWSVEAVSLGPALAGTAFYSLAVDPTAPERVVAATRNGLYRRDVVPDGTGVGTWAQVVLAVPASPNRDASCVVCVRGVFFAALRPVYNPADAALPWRNQAVVQPAAVLRSIDQGSTWNPIGTGFPANGGRITLAVNAEHPDIVYAATQDGGLWRLLVDALGAGTWKAIAWTPVPAGLGSFVGEPPDDRGGDDLALAVDPADTETLYCGGYRVLLDATGAIKVGAAAATDVYAAALWRVRVRPVGDGFVAQPVYLGAQIHPDLHALTFARGLSGQLWVGGDGGVAVTDSAQAARPVWRSVNSGLASALVNGLAQHPREAAVLFAATRGNGGQRSFGDEAWTLITEGDAGSCVVDWSQPFRVLMATTGHEILRCTDGGRGPASWHAVSVPTVAGDAVEPLPPLAGTPISATAADSFRVAFGTRRLWLSDTFGNLDLPPLVTSPGDWQSIPANDASDALPDTITAITFAAYGMVYAGTRAGSVYRYVQAAQPGPWVRTQINTLGATPLPAIAAPITDIQADRTDASGNSVYVVFGGGADRRHVWRYDNLTWTDRSGPAGATGLLNAQANALAVDPGNPTHLYLATDIGVWRSSDSGLTWQDWHAGLPEAAATDILIHDISWLTADAVRLIRVATSGRGVFSRRLGAVGAAPPDTTSPVELYVRKHRIDLGLATATYGQADPDDSAALIAAGTSPDIRCDAPDATGAYRFPADQRLSLVDFFEIADDDSAAVPTAAQPVATRVHVLVHNRGPRWAHDVSVTVLIAPGRHGGLAALPAGWDERVRAGLEVSGNGWQTVGQTTVSDLRPGHPQVATVTLSSALLPLPGALAGNSDHSLLVAVHHNDDPLLSDLTDAEAVVNALRHVALRHFSVVAHVAAAAVSATLPARFLPIGPTPMLNGLAQGGPPVAGRTPGLAVSRHGNIVYAGTANGGVWRSDDGGGSWRSCMEAFDLDPAALQTDSLACPVVAIHPDHPERVFVGTGEPFGNGDAYFGVGMLRSVDGGRNWLREPTVACTAAPVLPLNVPPALPVAESAILLQRGCYAVAVDPLAPERAVAATNVGAFLRESDGSGGFRWRRMWMAPGVNLLGAAMAPTDNGDVTSVTCATAGPVTTFVAALRGGQVLRFTTADAGFVAGQPVWQPLGAGSWPTQAGSRCAVAMKADDPTVVYLVRADGNGYRWDAGPNSWATITPMPSDTYTPPNGWSGTQGNYDLAVAVDPGNVNRILLGGAIAFAARDRLTVKGDSEGNWYSSIWQGTVVASGANWTLNSSYIGARAHADVHRLVLTPGDGSQLWAGCDGGVFRCDGWDQDGAFFIPRNRGLATLQGTRVKTHPTEDAIILLGTQDNGAALGLGTPGWRMVSQGDSGQSVWHWGDALNGVPVRALITYIHQEVSRYAAGGSGAAEAVHVSAPKAEFDFYPPMVAAPLGALAAQAQAGRVAFGGVRLWLTDTFGGPATNTGIGDWASLPSGTLAADSLPTGDLIIAIAFLKFDRIVVGTNAGNCYLYDRPIGAPAWVGPQSLAVGGTWPLPGAVSVTGISRDPADPDKSFFVCLGNNAGTRRVWHAQVTVNPAGIVTATAWTLRSGAGANQLLNVNHNSIVADGANLYVAADIGMWRSTDAGANWQPFSDGLPDAPLVDLEIAPNRLLRVATHGRGTFERELTAALVPRVRLVIRETLLDRGLRAADYDQPGNLRHDHRGNAVGPASSPDIVVEAPLDGAYQSPNSPHRGLDPIEFAALVDRSATVATHAAGVLNRVHVQVQNTGPESCSGATVHLLLAEAVAGAPPALPADHVAALRSGLTINGGGWTTVGVRRLAALDSREPAIASFDLHSSRLPKPDSLDGHSAWYLLALASHELDRFPDPGIAVQALATAHRQAALKSITVTALAGDPPATQAPPRAIASALPLAVALAADRRLIAMARDSQIRANVGVNLTDTDRALDALVQAAAKHLRGGPQLPLAKTALAAGIGRYVALGAIGLDLPDWADWLETRPGWMRTALRRGSADVDISATLADALSVVIKTATYALNSPDPDPPHQHDRIRAFCAGMACAVAAEVVMGPVLRGAAAQRGPADALALGSVDRAIAETWVSRVLLDSAPERDAYADWVPEVDDLPAALLPALARALQETIGTDLASRRVATTAAPPNTDRPSAEQLNDGLKLWRSQLSLSTWGMGTWFLVLLPVFLAPSLGVMLSRFGDHSGRLLKITDESKGPDDPANDSDEKSWYQAANFTLSCGIPAPFAYNLALWSIVPRRDADFVQFTVAGGLRTLFAVVGAATMSAPTGLRWGLVFTPWIATDLYFLVRSLVDYAQGRPGSGFLKMIQVLPLMGLSVGWLFCLLIRRANLRRDEQFWPMWGLFTGMLLGGGLIMAWRMAAGGGLVQMLRDRSDPALKFDAFAGSDLLGLPSARARVFADHQLWNQGAGLADERFPAGMRPLLKLWHADAGWKVRPWSDHVEFSQNDGAPISVPLPKVQNAAQLLTSLTTAVAGLQGAVVDPAGFDLLWPVRLATHGDDQPTWAAHAIEAEKWRALGADEAGAYLLRHAPRSRTAAAVGAPLAAGAEGPLRVVPDRDATDPLGADLIGTALGKAGDLAALFQMALAPVLTPNLQARLAAGPVPLTAGREVLRRWNLDERREAEWRLLVGLDAAPDEATERLSPGAAAPSSGEAIARLGLVPTIDAWATALRDDRINLNANTSSPAMPLVRPRGEAPRQVLHSELRDALRALLSVP